MKDPALKDADIVTLASRAEHPAVRWLAQEVLRLRVELAVAQRDSSDKGWALDAARQQYEIDHSLDWR